MSALLAAAAATSSGVPQIYTGLAVAGLFAWRGYFAAQRVERQQGRSPYGWEPTTWSIICFSTVLFGRILLAAGESRGRKNPSVQPWNAGNPPAWAPPTAPLAPTWTPQPFTPFNPPPSWPAVQSRPTAEPAAMTNPHLVAQLVPVDSLTVAPAGFAAAATMPNALPPPQPVPLPAALSLNPAAMDILPAAGYGSVPKGRLRRPFGGSG